MALREETLEKRHPFPFLGVTENGSRPGPELEAVLRKVHRKDILLQYHLDTVYNEQTEATIEEDLAKARRGIKELALELGNIGRDQTLLPRDPHDDGRHSIDLKNIFNRAILANQTPAHALKHTIGRTVEPMVYISPEDQKTVTVAWPCGFFETIPTCWYQLLTFYTNHRGRPTDGKRFRRIGWDKLMLWDVDLLHAPRPVASSPVQNTPAPHHGSRRIIRHLGIATEPSSPSDPTEEKPPEQPTVEGRLSTQWSNGNHPHFAPPFVWMESPASIRTLTTYDPSSLSLHEKLDTIAAPTLLCGLMNSAGKPDATPILLRAILFNEMLGALNRYYSIMRTAAVRDVHQLYERWSNRLRVSQQELEYAHTSVVEPLKRIL